MNKTSSVKINHITHKWYYIDCTNQILGRLSTVAADIINGKTKVQYSNNADNGDYLILINAKKILLSKNKLETKMYYNHSGYIGGLRTRSAKVMKEKYLDEMLRRSISGMLPKNKLRAKKIKRLFIFEDNKHRFDNFKPTKVEI